MSPCDIPDNALLGVSDNCVHGDVRLVGGHYEQEGRLEMCYEDEWTPFCDIDESVALVACKQLGYTQTSCKLSRLKEASQRYHHYVLLILTVP